ncbi:hypothetical protein [Methylobacterium soli]|uniref:Uncharacterized protein n=1 Tax=Methylobacterium soli TaxID=553447 RepID=A0A6L3SZI0_9HYPH|nr:hypothetical protein [Methylobacterium soli]KAB1075905.1 hypothetical protein F6X53_24040 [Methylobacterium soli]GJE46217.1 hypothetical protein AEGHOMDF_5417 [Methylobacterium soli]
MKKLIAVSTFALTIAGSALAQGFPAAREPEATGTVIQRQLNNTGNDRSVIIAPGATGAETIETDSAAGGNAGQPSRAVPQGGASGSGGNGGVGGG